MNSRAELKKGVELKLAELRLKRKQLIGTFRKKVEDTKIEQVKKSILHTYDHA